MNKLRKKFVLAVFISAAVVFLLTVVLTFLGVKLNTVRREDEMTSLIMEKGGELASMMRPEDMNREQRLFSFNFNEESPYRMRFFMVFFENGEAFDADVSRIASVDREEAIELASGVIGSRKSTGYSGVFRYRLSDDRLTAVFLDCSEDSGNLKTLILMLSLVSLLFVTLITVVFYFVSKRVVRPFEENSRMQKRFVTDASHELKTPLAIISANAEVLAYKNGDNEWIRNILAQVDRSSGLINELLTLNRLEEIETNTDVKPVDMSAVTKAVADEFSEVFKGKNVEIESAVDEGVTLNGQEDQLRRLVSVLVENASKYVSGNGRFLIGLKKAAKYSTLTVFNTCELDGNMDYKNLFERFYRPDSSRTSVTGGHGVGLSIAKRIADLHGGTISAAPEDGGLKFTVTLSNRLRPKKK